MLQSWRAVFTRFRALLRSDAAGVRAGFYALLLSSAGDLIAGLRRVLPSYSDSILHPNPLRRVEKPHDHDHARYAPPPQAAADLDQEGRLLHHLNGLVEVEIARQKINQELNSTRNSYNRLFLQL